LKIKPLRKNYSVGDTWQTVVDIPRAGFLSCYHQSDDGPITQVSPIQPNAAFAVGEGQEISIPNPSEGFDIKFERPGVVEKLMCILEISTKPMAIQNVRANSVLGPMQVHSFEQVLDAYRKKDAYILWGQIQDRG